jgi:hypothetical protein
MTDPTSTGTLAAQVAALRDDRAVQVLALAVHKDRAPTPTDPLLESHLREAAQHADTATVPVRPGASDGELARATLTYLAGVDPGRAADVRRAIAITGEDPTQRFIDPASLLVGGLVLLALQTEIGLDRDQGGQWRFRFRKHPMSDTTLGTVIGKFIGAYSGTGGE